MTVVVVAIVLKVREVSDEEEQMGLFGWFRRKRTSAVAESPSPLATVDVGGRKHALGVPYMLPKDEGEINRLDFQHYMLRFSLRGNYSAPIAEPKAILDVGTGTGRWAREMAELFLDARVIGLDIAVPKADESAESLQTAEPLPPNYSFVPGNVLEGLPFADGEFDFTHQRLLVTAIPLAQWPQVIGELARVTRPGGWVELVETGLSRGQGENMNLLLQSSVEFARRRGIDLQIGLRLGDLLREAGLANVVVREVPFLLGPRGGHVGQMAATDMLTGINGLKGPAVAMGILDAETYDRAMDAWRDEMQVYEQIWPFYIAYGQRAR